MSHKTDAERAKKRILAERKRLHQLGVCHKKWGQGMFYDETHAFFEDYAGGYHGRPFRKQFYDLPLLAKVFLRLAAWCGA